VEIAKVTSEIAFNTELYTSVGGRLRGSLDHGREHLDQTVEIAKTKVLPLLAIVDFQVASHKVWDQGIRQLRNPFVSDPSSDFDQILFIWRSS